MHMIAFSDSHEGSFDDQAKIRKNERHTYKACWRGVHGTREELRQHGKPRKKMILDTFGDCLQKCFNQKKFFWQID